MESLIYQELSMIESIIKPCKNFFFSFSKCYVNWFAAKHLPKETWIALNQDDFLIQPKFAENAIWRSVVRYLEKA